MNYKHFQDFKEFSSPYQFKYFDNRVNEEDNPINIPVEVHQKYEELDILFEELFDENSLHFAKQSSKDERDKKGLDDSSFVYGEITFRSLSYIIEYIKIKFGEEALQGGSFLDLGSGIGRGIVAASLIHKFEKYLGIEYLENLHILATEVVGIYNEKILDIMKNYERILPKFESAPILEIINGDFLKYDWSSCNLIFANSTCFSPELMKSLSGKADELKQGAFFITFTKKLPDLSDKWEVCDGFRRLMSWGIATVYVHRKIL